jgi:hypothetical protein
MGIFPYRLVCAGPLKLAETGGQMPAIEYGSYYWCVVLAGEERGGESIHLHADSLSIEGGSLVFKSIGRRPAGTDPKNGDASSGERSEGKPKDASDNKEMVYIAFAAGSWKMVYAAKLQDGSPASVEHWRRGEEELPRGNNAAATAASSGMA